MWLTSIHTDQGAGVAGVSVQQQPEWNPGRRDGSGENDSDHRPGGLPHGTKGKQRTLPHHCTTLVSLLTLALAICITLWLGEKDRPKN